mmetsp:Transcript_79895/g.230961  ORF Transcript_79895/g.230961 Transcript_79895/m.230961 type:complete len:322 (+) Transcript_79895:182-1147(+)
MKCVPCLRGCAFVKTVVGSIMLVQGLYMAGHTPSVLDCNEQRTACPGAFGRTVSRINGETSYHLDSEAAVDAFCDCLYDCINYILIYNGRGSLNSEEPTNCFAKSVEAGVPSMAAAGNRTSSKGSLPAVNEHTCVTCAGASEAQESTYVAVAVLCALCGVAMVATAGCEILGIRLDNACFSVGVVAGDALAGVLLFGAVFLSLWSLGAALQACNQDAMREILEQAGRESTDGDDNKAAIFAEFLMSALQPLSSGVCSQQHEFSVYAAGLCLAGIASCWSFCAFCCVISSLTDDDSDESPHERMLVDWRMLKRQPADEDDEA